MRRTLLFVSALLVCSCIPVKDDAPPFSIGATWGAISRKPIKPQESFYYSVSVSALRPLDNVMISVSVPKEVSVSKVEILAVSGGKTIASEERKGAEGRDPVERRRETAGR